MRSKTEKIIVFFITFIMFDFSHAGEVKVRAREHIDFHNVDINGGDSTSYSGLSNTINIWWEKPGVYSVGLAFNPIFGSAKPDDDASDQLGDKIKLITLGIEGKYYHRYVSKNLFSRIGVGGTRLDSNGEIGDVDGYHAYMGIGWEFDIKGVGLALEMAFRHSGLEQNIVVNSVTPSIGVHFYH